MNHKDNRRVKITKKILAESLLELLNTEDIHKITIRQLCEHADINRSTFYKYYGSQYDLLMEVENELLEQIERKLSLNDSIPNNLECLINILTFAQDNSKIFKLLINANVDPNFPMRLFNLPSVYQGINRSISVNKPNELIYIQDLIFYGVFQMIKRWINNDHRESPVEMANIIGRVFQKIASE